MMTTRELNPQANPFTARQNQHRENFQRQTRSQSPQRQIQTEEQVFRTEVQETTINQDQLDSTQSQEQSSQQIFKTLRQQSSNSQKQPQGSQIPVRRESIRQEQPHTPQTQESKQRTGEYQAGAQNGQQSIPGDPILCAFCKDHKTKQQASHTTRSCNLFREAKTETKWRILRRQTVCALCLEGSHGLTRCPEFKGNESKCFRCNFAHHSNVACRPQRNQTRQKTPERAHLLDSGKGSNYSRTVPVIITHPRAERSMIGLAIIDDQASMTMLNRDAIDIMGLPYTATKPDTLSTITVQGQSPAEKCLTVSGL